MTPALQARLREILAEEWRKFRADANNALIGDVDAVSINAMSAAVKEFLSAPVTDAEIRVANNAYFSDIEYGIDDLDMGKALTAAREAQCKELFEK